MGEESHPALAGRADELGALTDAVRRLIAASVLNRAPASVLAEVASLVDGATERLEAHVPDPPPTLTGGGLGPGRPDTMAGRMPMDVVIGRYSPLALPVTVEFEPPKAVGRGRFTAPYEGPPGCVHGGVIAATFDIVLSAANLIEDAAGPTVSLTLRYRRPTLLHDEAVFEAWIDRREGERTFTKGRLVQRGEVTVEVEGVFAAIDRARILALRDERT